MGTAFFKTGVDIVLLDKEEDVYGISLHAAYVGDKPEADMATFYDVERGIKQCLITIEIEPVSADSFTFDFEVILRKLDKVLATSNISGKEVAAAMLNDNVWDTPDFTLPSKDGYAITIQPGCIGHRMGKVKDKLVDQWSVEGSCLSGNLQRDYGSNDENAKEKPTFLIIITKEDVSKHSHDSVIWKVEEQKKIIALSNQIATALR